MKKLPHVTSLLVAGMFCAANARAQASYRNLDAGFPVRVEDATVTERYALDLDFLNFRYDELSDLRTRFQYEPRVSYGIFPRTEMWMRLPVFYRERTASPRGGVAGFGIGAMYQLNLEMQHVPAVAVASEFFKPTGPNALPASYSFRTIATRSFAPFRLHLNGSIASYAIRTPPSLIITCPGKTAPGSTCGGVALPPLDGPCSIGSQSSLAPTLYCAAPQSELQSATQAAFPGEIQTHAHWLLGAGVDKAFALTSTLVVADVFAEKFEGIGRKTDATAEIGVRHQVRPQVVLVGGLGRHFSGAGFSTFVTLGMTLSHALQFSGRGS
jgi:hypothetical protein